MANEEHLSILNQGVGTWNSWRDRSPTVSVDLRGADLSIRSLSGADLRKADMRGANLRLSVLSKALLLKADLSGADLVKTCFDDAALVSADLSHADLTLAHLARVDLFGADLTGACLNGAHLWDASLRRAKMSGASLLGTEMLGADISEGMASGADMRRANLTDAILHITDLSEANLSQSNLGGADLFETNLSKANLSGASLAHASLVGTRLQGATLDGAWVYGVSVWDVQLDGASQKGLVITPGDMPAIAVDDLDVAQFIYLLLNNQNVRSIIDTVTSKAVLILGRFTSRRKAVLDGIAVELRNRGYAPIIFDFDQPTNRSTTETVRILAQMSRFVIADLTDPQSVGWELGNILPGLTSVPVQLVIHGRQKPFSMAADLVNSPCVLPLHRYHSQKQLIKDVNDKVIRPAEEKARKIVERRRQMEAEWRK